MGLNFGITVQCPVFRIPESVVEKVRRITRLAVGKERTKQRKNEELKYKRQKGENDVERPHRGRDLKRVLNDQVL